MNCFLHATIRRASLRVHVGHIQALLVAALALPLHGASQAVTKEAMLEGIARNVIVPGYQQLALKCRDFTAAAEQLSNNPTSETLGKARQAWINAQLAAREMQWLQTGPIADLEYLSTFYYSKILTSIIEEVLNSSRTLDDTFLGELGPGTRNMFAAEYLLFEKKSASSTNDTSNAAPDPIKLFGTKANRRCQFVLMIAKDVQRKAEKVSESWTSTNRQDAAGKFIAGGQATLNSLINQLAKMTEVLAETHLNFVLHLPSPILPQLDRIEGSRSDSTLVQYLAMLRGINKAFSGGNGVGVDDYLSSLNQPLATRGEQQFQKCKAALEAIQPPLEKALTDRKQSVEQAFDAVHTMEILFKVDLASGLGVTITFSSNDGD